MIKSEDLNSVDSLMRYLDLPFNPDLWTSLYASHSTHTLTAYLELISQESYTAENWASTNELWRLAREAGEIEENISVLKQEKHAKLARDWSSNYSIDDLMFLDDFYQRITATQNVSTPILQELARDLCEIELRIKNGMRAGLDVKKDMDARDNIIKMGHFDAASAKNTVDFDSTGELMVYLEKKGWHPDWHQEPQDNIDLIMNNVQQYLQRLVANEPSISDQVEDARQRYNTTERVEELNLSVKDEGPSEFEGEDELASELNAIN